MARIYVASSWRNEQHDDVVAQLEGIGHQVFNYRRPWFRDSGFKWEQINDVQIGVDVRDWQSWPAYVTQDVLTTSAVAAFGFLSDFRGMQWADTCVLLLPSGRSAHMEAGYMAGQGKRTVVYLRDGEEPDLMHLLATDLVTNFDELANLLSQS